MDAIRIYTCKRGFNNLISSVEAEENKISVAGCHLASITKLTESIVNNGDADAFGGTVIECSEGFYKYDYDQHCYCEV